MEVNSRTDVTDLYIKNMYNLFSVSTIKTVVFSDGTQLNVEFRSNVFVNFFSDAYMTLHSISYKDVKLFGVEAERIFKQINFKRFKEILQWQKVN